MKALFYSLILAFVASTCSGIAKETHENVVIIGAGPAGTTSAMIAGQADLNPLVIEGPTCTGQLEIIHLIDNYPGFLEEVSGAELLSLFRQQAVRYGARYDSREIVEIDLSNRPFQITLNDGDVILSESIIAAQGVTKKWLGLENEEKLLGKGVMGTSICKRGEFEGKEVAVVGGGHAALQEALTIAEFASKVTLVNRSTAFNASAYHQNLVFSNAKIEIIYQTEVEDILDPAQGHVTELRLKNSKTGEKSSLPVDGVVIAIGSSPNTDLFKDQIQLTPTRHLALPNKNTQTSVQGVFAAGDVSELSYGRVITAAGTGAMAALDTIRFLTENKK